MTILTSQITINSDAFKANRKASLAAMRSMRDAKLMEIGAGTSEIRRMLIGRELMKETG